MAEGLSWHSLPLFVRLVGKPVIVVGEGAAAEAKRRLLSRAGARIVGENDSAGAQLAIVALAEPEAAVARLRERNVLVNAVDRPDLCDFTLPAIVDRDPVLIAIGTGGASAGLAAALRQRFETLLPASLGSLARALGEARDRIRTHFPDANDRRRAIGAALSESGALDLFVAGEGAIEAWLATDHDGARDDTVVITLRSADPDDMTLREARMLANADRVCHRPDVPAAILDRARADAPRIVCATPPVAAGPGMTVFVEMA
jgi:uroporphyrin-III C-methyltransferase / precorrin-2 dehydrogenase / sirohydrochlorin ferrochelatase